jgi:SAM-dependent methyltransferase
MSGYIGTKESKLLHFAPSRATHRWLLTFKNIEATNTDINPNGYRHVPDMVQADITALHFDDGLFDFVFCSHVMEHIPDDFQAMTELHRVLKPGGIAFLMVPLLVDGKGPIEDPSKTLPRHRLRYFGQVDHVRIYDSPTFIERLEKAGFNVDVFDPYANDPIKAVAYGIGQGNAVFVAKK